MSNYYEQIAQWRQQRDQETRANRIREMSAEYAQASRERDQLIAENNLEEAAWRDDDCKQLEREWLEYNPPQQQIDPRWTEWTNRHRTFFERTGQQGVNAVQGAFAYLCRPRNPNPTTHNPAHNGCGMAKQAYTPAFFDRLESVLEMHAPMYYGVRFDPSEKTLDANEAAKVAGLSPQQYNQASREVGAQRMFSWQRK